MKQIISAIVIVAAILSLSINCFAFEEIGMVYSSRYEQQRIYKLAMTFISENRAVRENLAQNEAVIVEESITPIYTMTPLWIYYNTKKITLSTGSDWEYYTGSKQRSFDYVAKIVDGNGNHYGYASITDFENRYYDPDSETYSSPRTGIGCIVSIHQSDISYSYADHAERIRQLLGLDEIIPAQDVRLVEGMFYINHDGIEGFVALSNFRKGFDEWYDTVYNKFIYMADYDLVAKAAYEDHLKMLEEEKQFKVTHPNERYENLIGNIREPYEKVLMESGDTGDPDLMLNNVINCYEYLGLDPAIHYPGADPRKIILASCAAAVVIAASFVIVRGVGKKKSEQQE